MKKYTYEEVQKAVAELSDCELLSTEYHSVSEKLQFRCSCGSLFETDFHHFLAQRQRQCRSCSIKARSEKRRLTVETINQRLALVGCKYVSGDYRNRKSKIVIRCSCGHEKEMQLNNAFSPKFSGLCQECSDKQFRGQNRFTVEQVREACENLGIELLSTEYRSMKDPMEFRCSCGRNFVTTWEIVSYYSKTRCDYCTHKMSGPEQRIADWLDAHQIAYERQKEFPGCGGKQRKYKFDFYLPELDTCVEYDGQQHFKIVDFSGKADDETLRKTLFDTQCRDLVKDIYCDEHGIKLIRIRYEEVEQIESILSDTLIPR